MLGNRKSLTRTALWASAVLLILAVGIVYFPRERPELGFWGALYFTIRLFILEHDLGHFPRHSQLIVIYFLAPLVSLSVIGTAVRYFFRLSPALRMRWQSDHVVICGVGRTGKLLASTLQEKRVAVVGVDAGCPDNFEEYCGESGVPMVYGDFRSHVILKRAGAAKARAIIFSSGDDLLNLEGAIGAYGWLLEDGVRPGGTDKNRRQNEPPRNSNDPARLIWVHIAREQLADTARLAVRTRPPVGIRFFDTYYMAATKMVAKYFGRERRQQITSITILGFGKFGRDLLEVLIRDLDAAKERTIQVVDIQDRQGEVHTLAAEFGVADRVRFQRADIADLDLADSEDQAFFLCTDDDVGNLAAALLLTRKVSGTHIYVRMSRWPMPAVEDHLSENRGIEFVNINDLVIEGLLDLAGIFTPAALSDLKRIEGRDS